MQQDQWQAMPAPLPCELQRKTSVSNETWTESEKVKIRRCRRYMQSRRTADAYHRVVRDLGPVTDRIAKGLSVNRATSSKNARQSAEQKPCSRSVVFRRGLARQPFAYLGA